MLVNWLRGRGLSAEYQWLRWEPSLYGLFSRFKWLLIGSDAISTDALDLTKKSEDTIHGRWTGLKDRLFSFSVFRMMWLSYSTRDYFNSYKKASRGWRSEYVVMDRYLFDYVVDQSLNFSIPPLEFIDKIRSTKLEKMKKPVYSIFVNIPAVVGYQRKLDGTPLEYLKQRESLYKQLPAGDDVFYIDGTKTQDDIHSEITCWLASKIGIAK